MLDNVVVKITIYRRTKLVLRISILFKYTLAVYIANIGRQRNKQARNNCRQKDLDDIR